MSYYFNQLKIKNTLPLSGMALANPSPEETHSMDSTQASRTKGNALLDEERLASMADEGGAAGAEIEAEEPEMATPGLRSIRRLPDDLQEHPGAFPRAWIWVAGAAAIAGAAGLYFFYRRRSEPALQPE
jgi:hypothetical protein